MLSKTTLPTSKPIKLSLEACSLPFSLPDISTYRGFGGLRRGIEMLLLLLLLILRKKAMLLLLLLLLLAHWWTFLGQIFLLVATHGTFLGRKSTQGAGR